MEPKELTIDEELELMTRKMCSVRKPKEIPIEDDQPQVKEARVVDKREKSRAKEARRKAKKGQ